MCVNMYVLTNLRFDGCPFQFGYETWWEGRWAELQQFYSRKYFLANGPSRAENASFFLFIYECEWELLLLDGRTGMIRQ